MANAKRTRQILVNLRVRYVRIYRKVLLRHSRQQSRTWVQK